MEGKQFRFNKKALLDIPPNPPDARSKECEYSDTEVRGLKILVSKTGRKFFYFRYRFKKGRRAFRIGEFPAVSVQEARETANNCKNMLARGIDPQQEKDNRAQIPLFCDFVRKEYHDIMMQKSSWKTERSMLNKYLIPSFGKLSLDSISRRDLEQYITRIRQQLSPATCNRHLAFLHRLFQICVEWKILMENPVAGIKPFSEDNQRQRFLSQEETRRFLQALDNLSNQVAASVLRFALVSGLRKGEILKSKWEYWDQQRELLYIPSFNTKAKKSRYVTLNAAATEVLQSISPVSGNPYIFAGKLAGEPLKNLERPFRNVLRMAKLQDLRIHDLRHSFASICVNGGASLYEVQQLLGHSNIRMTQRYAHLTQESLHKATSNVSQFMDSVAGVEREFQEKQLRLLRSA